MSKVAVKLWFSVLTLAALVALALPVCGVLTGKNSASAFPVRWIAFEGHYQHVSAEQVRASIAPALKRGFFGMDLAQVRGTVSAMPWVEQVEVRKRWPDTLQIRVRERTAVARWGDSALLNERGEAFSAEGVSAISGLPKLFGPQSRQAELLAFCRTSEVPLRALGLHIVQAHFSDRGSLSVLLSNGIKVKVGREDLATRWPRLLESLPTLLASDPSKRVVAVDLRYTNGLAVSFEALLQETPSDGGAQPASPVRSTPIMAGQLRTPQ